MANATAGAHPAPTPGVLLEALEAIPDGPNIEADPDALNAAKGEVPLEGPHAAGRRGRALIDRRGSDFTSTNRNDMPQTRTADSKDASGKPVEPATDPQATGTGSTHANATGEASPRLPHEQDESSDSGSRPPDPIIEQAAKDAESPKQPTDRGETTDAVYQQHLRGSAGDRK